MKKTRVSQKMRLTIAAMALWFVTCAAITHCYTIFDGAFGDMRIYFWLYAPLVLVLSYVREQPPKQDSPRWAQALTIYLCTALLFIMLKLGIDLRYEVWAWTILLILVFQAIASLSGYTDLSHQSEDCAYAHMIILVYSSYLLALIGMLVILHPLTVAEIRPIGEAQGLQFVGRTSTSTDEMPLGAYTFSDSNNMFYDFDILTGMLVRQQSLSDRLTEMYGPLPFPKEGFPHV